MHACGSLGSWVSGFGSFGPRSREGSGQNQLLSHLGPGALAKPGSLGGPCESTRVARTRSSASPGGSWPLSVLV